MTQEASQAPISGVDAVMKEGSAQAYWVRRVIAFAIDAFIVYFAVGLLVILAAASFLVLSGP